MDRFELLKNLLVMAVVDGRLSAPEYVLLAEQIDNWGLTDEQFSEAVDYALSADARLTIPGLVEIRDELSQGLTKVTHADGGVVDVQQR